MQLQGMAALVTGANGFVGGYAARRLAQAGMEVRALVRDPARGSVVDLELPGLRRVRGDLTDPASLQVAADGATVVVHCAADMRMRHEHVTRAVTVEGTRRLYLAARQGGAELFVHMSTIAVYLGAGEYHEDARLVPSGDRYADAKLEAELALWELAGEPRPGATPLLQAGASARPRVVILRPPPVYAPGSRFWTATLAGLVARGLPACLDGGRGVFPYVYAENLADAVLASVERVLGPGQAAWPTCRAYNVVDGLTTWAAYLGYFGAAFGRSVRSLPAWPLFGLAALAEAWARCTGRRARLTRANLRFITARALPGYTADRAQRELGWRPRVSLDEGMARSLAWLRGQGDSRGTLMPAR